MKYTLSEQKEDKTEEAKKQLNFAIYTSLKMVLNGIIAGFAFAIALILQTPIQNWVSSWNIVNENLIALYSILIYFGFAIIFVLILIPISKLEAKNK